MYLEWLNILKQTIAMNLLILSIALFLNSFINQADIKSKMQGAWRSDEGIAIISGNYFAYTVFTSTNFINTYGGHWSVDGSTLKITGARKTSSRPLILTAQSSSTKPTSSKQNPPPLNSGTGPIVP